MTTLTPKQLVLSKIKGFPDWPSIIVPLDNIPNNLKSSSKNKKFLENYPQGDQICVKFYYDDQYSFTKKGNIKPLTEQVVKDYLISVGENVDGIESTEGGEVVHETKRGGRKKRITEAYLKVLEVPIDEFLQWGSWGKPITPEPEEEIESDKRSLDDDDDVEYGVVKKQKKVKGRKPGRPKKEVVEKEKKRGRPGRKPKKVEEEEEDEEEMEVFEDDDDDDEYEGSEESPEIEEEDDEEEEEDIEIGRASCRERV